jgi:hypothetical protein
MKRIVVMVAIAFIVAGCTSVRVKKVEATKHQIQSICIEKNPIVTISDFLSVVEMGFMRHGIETKVYGEGQVSPDCEYTLTYTAHRAWDIAFFLDYGELRLKQGSKTIGTATYRHRGGFALNKWASTESKMTPVIDELLSDF